MSAVEIGALANRLADVRARIDTAVTAAGRTDEVTLIVVTKFHGADMVRALASLGVTDVGENRHQEASEKHAECADLNLRWHFIGQLQSNKAAAVRRYADVVHSVDRPSLVDALDRAGNPDGPRLDCLVQVNLTDNPGRGGVHPDHARELAERIMAAPTLRLRGVMAVAPLHESPDGAFERAARVGELIRAIDAEATWLSMGMSQDFEAAIRYGATHLRIGTEITGKRAQPV